VNPDYPESDFPYTFYFNGEPQPKWGACWMMARVLEFLDTADYWSERLSYERIWDIYCRIDHVGCTESADPEVFLFTIQEILLVLLKKRSRVLRKLNQFKKDDAPELIYQNLLTAAFRMHELVLAQNRAFWISGYAADQAFLLKTMRRCALPADHSEFRLAPHLSSYRNHMDFDLGLQLKEFHRLAQASRFDKKLRTKLHQLQLPEKDS
jgi:hypothetical protein